MAGFEDSDLTATIEPFDSFWEAPEDVERGYASFAQFYRANYLPYVPADRNAKVLNVSCGAGYFVALLVQEGWRNVSGIDSDPAKVALARKRGFDCTVERAFSFLDRNREPFDLIFCEQELNHLTKRELAEFLSLCHRNLRPAGIVIVHGLNGANPLTGPDALAQNFDHYHTFTEYSLRQVLEHSGFRQVRVLPLRLFVFPRNPLNYVGIAASFALESVFRLGFRLYGKSNRIFTKKIAAVAHRGD